MEIFKKIKNWWNDNQEKNFERYLEREEFKKELEEYSKDVHAIINSSIFNINDKPLEKAILIQNLHTQRNLNKATDSLKTATWILALATIVFAWSAIVDSPNSNYIITTLQGIVTIIVYFAIIYIALVFVGKLILFILKWKRFFKKNGEK